MRPTHTLVTPVTLNIGCGNGLTVIGVLMLQPVGSVYVTVPVLPEVLAVELTRPPGVVILMVVPVLLHAPPAVASLNWVELPAHIVVLPDIAAGNGFTVTVVCAVQPVGNV